LADAEVMKKDSLERAVDCISIILMVGLRVSLFLEIRCSREMAALLIMLT
jgi:hypothetical protein